MTNTGRPSPTHLSPIRIAASLMAFMLLRPAVVPPLRGGLRAEQNRSRVRGDSSPRRPSPVDHEVRARHVGGGFAREKNKRSSIICWFGHAAERRTPRIIVYEVIVLTVLHAAG